MIIYLCGLILDTLYYWVVKFIDLSSDRLLLDSFGWHARSSLHVKKKSKPVVDILPLLHNALQKH